LWWSLLRHRGSALAIAVNLMEPQCTRPSSPQRYKLQPRGSPQPALCLSLVWVHHNGIVGVAAVPSIAFRVILGAVLVWLIPARNGLQA
jgi:hypothetical protein